MHGDRPCETERHLYDAREDFSAILHMPLHWFGAYAATGIHFYYRRPAFLRESRNPSGRAIYESPRDVVFGKDDPRSFFERQRFRRKTSAPQQGEEMVGAFSRHGKHIRLPGES